MKRLAIAAAGAALLFQAPLIAQPQIPGQTATTPDERMPEACRKLAQGGPQMGGTQSMPMMQGGMMQGGMMQGGVQNMPMGQNASDAGRDYMQVMQQMNPNMMMGIMIADPDVAFACAMIPHHQGAIGMARAVLKHGKDAEIKKIAEKTIKEQEKDVKELTEAVEKHAK